jgi:hypothetical protein
MRKIVLLFVSAVVLGLLTSCAPVTVSKKITEYKYDNNVLVETYEESLTQTPEKTLPIHLRHQELYE